MYYDLFKKRYVTSGAQIRKLAKPIIKKVGIILKIFSFSTKGSIQISTSADPAHKSMAVQKILKVIFSIITYYYSRKVVFVTSGKIIFTK